MKLDSLKRREGRAKNKDATLETSKRVKRGLKPYIGRVLPNGMVDASCIGHMKWNEFIRFFTPKLLNMGEANFTKHVEWVI